MGTALICRRALVYVPYYLIQPRTEGIIGAGCTCTSFRTQLLAGIRAGFVCLLWHIAGLHECAEMTQLFLSIPSIPAKQLYIFQTTGRVLELSEDVVGAEMLLNGLLTVGV